MGGGSGEKKLDVQEQWVCAYGCGVYVFFSASLGVRGVCSRVVRILVRSRVLTCLYDKCVIKFNLSDEFSGNVGFRWKRISRHGPVEYCVRRPPPFPLYGLCGEFSVSEISFFRVM